MRFAKSIGIQFPTWKMSKKIWVYGWNHVSAVPMFTKFHMGWEAVRFELCKSCCSRNKTTQFKIYDKYSVADSDIQGEVLRNTEPVLCNLIHHNSLLLCLGSGGPV